MNIFPEGLCPSKNWCAIRFQNWCKKRFRVRISGLFYRTQILVVLHMNNFTIISHSDFWSKLPGKITGWNSKEAAVVRHSGLYSVNCVRIDYSSKNITVLGPCQFFDENILLQFFCMMHSIYLWGKDVKSWFNKKY